MKQVLILFLLFHGIFTGPSIISAEEAILRGITAEHNVIRQRVGSPALIWSEKLAEYAQQWADYLAQERECAMQHRSRTGLYSQKYGENIYWASAIRLSDNNRKLQQVTPAQVVQSWASEAEHYSYVKNSCQGGEVCGHYTQVVWRQTKSVGCGWAVCSDQSQIWVCNYDPAGNIRGQKPY